MGPPLIINIYLDFLKAINKNKTLPLWIPLLSHWTRTKITDQTKPCTINSICWKRTTPPSLKNKINETPVWISHWEDWNKDIQQLLVLYMGFLKLGFNTKSWSNDLDDLWAPSGTTTLPNLYIIKQKNEFPWNIYCWWANPYIYIYISNK